MNKIINIIVKSSITFYLFSCTTQTKVDSSDRTQANNQTHCEELDSSQKYLRNLAGLQCHQIFSANNSKNNFQNFDDIIAEKNKYPELNSKNHEEIQSYLEYLDKLSITDIYSTLNKKNNALFTYKPDNLLQKIIEKKFNSKTIHSELIAIYESKEIEAKEKFFNILISLGENIDMKNIFTANQRQQILKEFLPLLNKLSKSNNLDDQFAFIKITYSHIELLEPLQFASYPEFKKILNEFMEKYINLDPVKNFAYKIEWPEAPKLIRNMISFHKIKKGEISLGYSKNYYKINLEKDFEMQKFPVTQLQYAQIKYLAKKYMYPHSDVIKNKDLTPSFFSNGADAIEVQIGNSKIKMQPHNPVENLTYVETESFISQLNWLAGLKRIQSEFLEIIPDYKEGDVFDLPTRDQWESVLLSRGIGNLNYFFHKEHQYIPTAIHVNNSRFKTWPVGSKKARFVWTGYHQSDFKPSEDKYKYIGDTPFYDFDGNVAIWTKTKLYNYLQVVAGASFEDYGDYHLYSITQNELKSEKRTKDYKANTIGIRLIKYNPQD